MAAIPGGARRVQHAVRRRVGASTGGGSVPFAVAPTHATGGCSLRGKRAEGAGVVLQDRALRANVTRTARERTLRWRKAAFHKRQVVPQQFGSAAWRAHVDNPKVPVAVRCAQSW